MNADKHELKSKDNDLFDRIIAILEQARSNVVRAVNSNTVVAYWLIGREIVQDLQQGEQRAEYGEQVIEDLSSRLTKRYGRGFSVPNLRNFRQFYVVFQDRKPEIHYPSGSELPAGQKQYLAGSELSDSGQGKKDEGWMLHAFYPEGMGFLF